MVVRGVENPVVQRLVVALEKAGKKNKAAIWKRVAERIKASSRSRSQVNLGQMKVLDGQTIIVPGKVLGSGQAKKISVAALGFTASARQKLEKNGGKALTINQLMETNPKGSGVRIIG